MGRSKNIFKNIAALITGSILALLLAEGLLKVYNPFIFSVKGDSIVLRANTKYVIDRTRRKNIPSGPDSKLDDIMVRTTNSLGFRGKEPPEDLGDFLSIISIGGSTTACTFLSDGKTWSDILGNKFKNDFEKIWINNAGFDGHSTYGHIVLMEDYVVKLKPDIVLFLVGLNNQGINDLTYYDKSMMQDKVMFQSPIWFVKSMANHSEVFSLILNLLRHIQARLTGVDHKEIDFSSIKNKRYQISTEEEEERLKKKFRSDNSRFLMQYKKSLKTLIDISKKNNIDPVFITQSTLYGDIIFEDGIMVSHGKNIWISMEVYNDVTQQTGSENGVLVIDLAGELPRNPKYYYDFYHYTNEGAKKVADIIYTKLLPSLSVLKAHTPQP